MPTATHGNSFAVSEPGFAVRNRLTTMSMFPVDSISFIFNVCDLDQDNHSLLFFASVSLGASFFEPDMATTNRLHVVHQPYHVEAVESLSSKS
jgi:hypothetical protein